MRNGSRTDIKNALINLPGLAHWIPEAEKEKQMLKTDFSDIVIELPDPDNPGAWTEKYSDKLIEADEILLDYIKTSETIERFYRESSKNKYHWELFRALNDFQVTAPDLLSALRSFDASDPEQRKSGMENILSALDQFDKSWENLKSVYSRTRYVSYPENHIPDRYFHYASQREDLSWMIQPEELLHKMIKVRIDNL